MCSGSTAASGWVDYFDGPNREGVYRDVDISGCGFTATPVVSSSLGGNSNHWTSTGGAEPYWITATSFRIYVSSSVNASQAA